MPPAFPTDPRTFCITDVGSTTTKAILFRREADRWRYHRREAATTVEKPHEDVTIGVQQAFRALEQDTGLTLLSGDAPAVPYLSTSSAGGGLAMVVTGLVRRVTSRSAERVALGAGAILLDVIAMDDGRTPYEKIEALKSLRPDMVLLAGGFDGDAISGPVFLAELVRESGLRPKLSRSTALPVIYAGNVQAEKFVADTLQQGYQVHAVPNIRPESARENLDPAREAIHDLFMGHVMSQAPGYDQLLPWVAAPIVPTPLAFGRILGLAARKLGRRILAIDIGGATTDVFSAEGDRVVRTVSANLGMSYSILNVVEQAGIDALRALLDADVDTQELWDRIGNKLLRPTRLPATSTGMEVEWAAATLAIREAVKDHLRVLAGLSLSREREELAIRGLITTTGRKKTAGPEQLRLQGYDLVIGSGGILSHSPREAAALMLSDALRPGEPMTLAVDSAFMFPHLGVLSEQSPDLALQLFEELGLVTLGTLVRAQGSGRGGSVALKIRAAAEDGRQIDGSIAWGELRTLPLASGETIRAALSGPGCPHVRKRRGAAVHGGMCGLILDARGDAGGGEEAERAEGPRGAGALLESVPVTPAPQERESEGPHISEGRIRLRRELAIPGRVLVAVGETIDPEAVVARSTRQFLRPFFLEPSNALRVGPGEVEEHLLKRIGESIQNGEALARRKVNIFDTKEYRSPVDGTIERILPTGTVIVRERPEDAARMTAVRVAKDLRVRGDQIRPYLRVEVGQPIERRQWLAAKGLGSGGPMLTSASPVRGKIKDINLSYGIVTIEPLLEQLEVRAWMPGRVTEVTDRGCCVENEGVELRGSWGRGGEVHGRLDFEGAGADAIPVVDVAQRADLTAAADRGAKGLLAGSAHLEDIRETPGTFTVVLTEGFGERPMNPRARAALEAHAGRLALLDGTTELRVGVRRPRIILPVA
ncbi:MAG: hypothetical protein GF330_09305 [Candidatus Eisenbacteria bacterium]|nr:hypothetical protein [Candidatus Eisenbacteria bacterium]